MRNWLIGLLATLWMGAATAAGPVETVVFELDNFSCAACSITVEKALDRVPAVTARKVDATTASVRVTFDPSRVSASDIARVITRSGFPAKPRKTGG